MGQQQQKGRANVVCIVQLGKGRGGGRVCPAGTTCDCFLTYCLLFYQGGRTPHRLATHNSVESP